MEECFAAEARHTTRLPPRIDTPTGSGFIRVMPAVFEDVMGLKIMTLVEGLGNRYLILMYEVKSGELLATFDADELTRLRTAATTALAGRLMCNKAPAQLGLIGSGFEAVGHVRMFADLWPLERVTVFSPSRERCERFATAISAELGIEVTVAATADEAIRDQACVVLATKAKSPVIDGNALSPGTVVLSIGSTRLDLRELDDRTLERAAVVVADDALQVMLESADIAETLKSGALDERRIIGLSRLIAGEELPNPGIPRDLLVFKSVGTALQDLALARALYRNPAVRADGLDVGELTALKPFSAKAFPAAKAATAAAS
jgi:ornithine cyclodeaminase/alanine dehydrogenase-like protein (mu-crystallin family)